MSCVRITLRKHFLDQPVSLGEDSFKDKERGAPLRMECDSRQLCRDELTSALPINGCGHCGICGENHGQAAFRLSCSHVFGPDCFRKYARTVLSNQELGKSCPVCCEQQCKKNSGEPDNRLPLRIKSEMCNKTNAENGNPPLRIKCGRRSISNRLQVLISLAIMALLYLLGKGSGHSGLVRNLYHAIRGDIPYNMQSADVILTTQLDFHRAGVAHAKGFLKDFEETLYHNVAFLIATAHLSQTSGLSARRILHRAVLADDLVVNGQRLREIYTAFADLHVLALSLYDRYWLVFSDLSISANRVNVAPASLCLAANKTLALADRAEKLAATVKHGFEDINAATHRYCGKWSLVAYLCVEFPPIARVFGPEAYAGSDAFAAALLERKNALVRIQNDLKDCV